MINYDYDSFLRCHFADIFFHFSRGSKRVKQRQYTLRREWQFVDISGSVS